MFYGYLMIVLRRFEKKKKISRGGYPCLTHISMSRVSPDLTPLTSWISCFNSLREWESKHAHVPVVTVMGLLFMEEFKRLFLFHGQLPIRTKYKNNFNYTFIINSMVLYQI